MYIISAVRRHVRKLIRVHLRMLPVTYMRPILQVALDEVELSRALEIAKEAVPGGCDYIEAGTPLIKSEGMNAIRTLKKDFKDHVIVADMKTMDTGAIEVEMAIKSGAGIVRILGAATIRPWRIPSRSARKYGGKLHGRPYQRERPGGPSREAAGTGRRYHRRPRGHRPADGG